MRLIALFLFFSVTFVFANTNIKSLDIYSNKIFINQKLDLSQTNTKLLSEVRLEDLKFILDQSCNIESFDIQSFDYKGDKLSLQIAKINEKIDNEENQIKALKSGIAFIQNSNLSNIDNIDLLQKSSNFVKKQILEDYNKISKLDIQIKKDQDILKQLNKKRSKTKYSILNYNITCKKPVYISYPLNNIQKKALFEVDYNSKDEKLKLVNSLFITQSLGEDLKGVDINLFTHSYINQLAPRAFVPEYLDLDEKKEKADIMAIGDIRPTLMKKSVSKNISYDYFEDTTKSYFKASNVDLISGKQNKVIFAKDEYKAKHSLLIDGFSLSQAFYKVDFKSDKLYGVTNANLYLDNRYIGKTFLKEIKKDKISSIYFGINRFIDIKKELIKDIKQEPLFSLNKSKTQKVWEYKIKNNSNQKEKIVLLQRVPISKHKDIKVKLIGKSKESKIEKNGKIYFEFELNPNESKLINFGYEIEKPTK